MCRETQSDPGRGVSADMEPQRDNSSNYYEEPDMGVTSVLLHSLENQWSNNIVSDDSEDDDMLPTERILGHSG